MRILFINPVGQIGGAERVLLDCIASIRHTEPGHEIHLLLMDAGPLAMEASRIGAKVSVLAAPRIIRALGDSAMKAGNRAPSKLRMLARITRVAPTMWRYTRRLRRAIRSIAPDIIHSNGLKSHLITARANVRLPTVWHIHDFVGTRPMVAWLLRRVARDVTTIAISNAVSEDVRTWLPGSAPRVVLNGIDLQRFRPGEGDGSKLDQLANLAVADSRTIRVGLVATYARWKGHDVFLRAAAEIIRDPPKLPVRFYIVGGPIYTTRGSQLSLEELLSLSRELGLGEHVGFVPFQLDTPSIYRALDIVVHASTEPEPFGLTIAEAMACGRPVVVSVGGGAAELFTDGVDAVGVRPGDASGLASAVRDLVRDPNRRATLAANARQTAEKRFDRNRIGAALLAVYRTLPEVA